MLGAAGRERIVSNMSATELAEANRRQSEQFEEEKDLNADDDFDFVETRIDRRISNKFSVGDDSEPEDASRVVSKAAKTGGGKKKKK